TGKLPEVHAILRGKEHWFPDVAHFNEFRENEEAAGGELSVSDAPSSPKSKIGAPDLADHRKSPEPAAEGSAEPGANGQPDAPSELHFTELHEVRTINRALAALARFFKDEKIGVDFYLDMLIPQERTGSDRPRYILRRGEHEVSLEDLRGLPSA